MKTPFLIKTPIGNFLAEDDPGDPLIATKRRSVTTEEAEILKDLAKGKRVLDVGTGLGVSARAMAKTAKEVISVDVDPWAHSFEFPDNVKLVTKIPEWNFDLAFIDGSHKVQAVYDDLKAAFALIYILHDCYHWEILQAAKLADLREVKKYNTGCDMRMFMP